jgi:hypothetical protein
MVYFQTKNPNLGKFWRALGGEIWLYFMFGIFYGHWGYFVTIWYILCSFSTFYPLFISYTILFGIFYGYLVYFVVIWYVLACCTKKSGNPGNRTSIFGSTLYVPAYCCNRHTINFVQSHCISRLL